MRTIPVKKSISIKSDPVHEVLPETYEHYRHDEAVYAYWQEHQCFKAGYASERSSENQALREFRALRALREEAREKSIEKTAKKTGHTSLNAPTQAESVEESSNRQETPQQKADHYSIVLPPPNITGRLHMGHALNGTLQDLIIRYKRMCDCDVLWVPGTDHAGIATQTVVKKMLDAKGIDYRSIGRAAFMEHVFAWKKKYGGYILTQYKHLGCSFDHSRLRFTMDTSLIKAVNVAFKRLHEAGLIYKGKRIVNWCPIDRTALSDDEVEFTQGGESGYLIDILYPFAEATPGTSDKSLHVEEIPQEISEENLGKPLAGASSKALEDENQGSSGTSNFSKDLKGLMISTTRPETLFGDVAVAVHPDDPRYKGYIGRKLRLPLTDRLIPIIAESYVERDFGTGCLKITPAHDKNDFEIGKRRHLPILTVMNEDATMNEAVPAEFQGLSREECRAKVIDRLKAEQLLVRETPYQVPLGRSYRSKAVIEYRVSDQWFVKMKPLAEKLRNASEKLNFYPERVEKYYNSWLENIEDWCISRQIWWGHQIPAWICQKATQTPNGDRHNPHENRYKVGDILVGTDETDALRDVPEAERKHWKREEDVLDTWFSSALWPFSTMGWPNEKAPDFIRYFPTTTLSTAKDIIFFWVARMALLSYYFMGRLPFKHVYIHPTILDDKGRTMSKSKGNGIDPYHIIKGATIDEMKQPVLDARPSDLNLLLQNIEKEYKDGFPGVGADALRYTLLYLLTSSQSIQLSMKDFTAIGRRFTTKFWNIARLVFLKIDASDPSIQAFQSQFPHLELNHYLADAQNELSSLKEQLSEESLIEEQILGKWTDLPLEDQWIEWECSQATASIHKAYQTFDFSNLGATYYKFIWTHFCDHYLEMLKPRFPNPKKTSFPEDHHNNPLHNLDSNALDTNNLEPSTKESHKESDKQSDREPNFAESDTAEPHDIDANDKEPATIENSSRHAKDENLKETLKTLVFLIRTFKRLLILIHPVTPFITEHLWGKLRQKLQAHNLSFLMPHAIPLIDYPYLTAKDFKIPNTPPHQQALSHLFEVLKQMIGHIRALRKRYRIHHQTLLRIRIETIALKAAASTLPPTLLKNWMFVHPVDHFTEAEQAQAVTLRSDHFTLHVDLSDHIDWASEQLRLRKERDKFLQTLTNVNNRLKNKDFLAKARSELVESEKLKARTLTQTLQRIETELATIAERSPTK